MSIVVAIDGPAGAGKSTVARTVADRAGFTLVDTGAIYRALAWASLDAGVSETDEDGLAVMAAQLRITFELDEGVNRVFLNGADVSDEIRRPDMSMRASTVSKHPDVREALLELQRGFGEGEGGVVLEGRDIGTVVFPDAQVKVFLTATDEERARRRTAELITRGTPQPYDEVLVEIQERDKQDSERAAAPLKAADDARVLDSTKLSIDDVVDIVLQDIAEVQK
jgi:cytidylate kinase